MLVYVVHKSRRSRAKTGKEMYKKRDARAKLLTTLHVHHAILYISLPSLHYYNVKVFNFTFFRWQEHKPTIFFSFSWTLIQFFKIQL